MGHYLDIRDKLQTLLEGVQVDGETALASVVTKPTSTFDTYPAATLLPMQVPSEVGTNTQNDRSYTFTVMIHLRKTTDLEQRITDGLKVIDAVLDAIDGTYNLDGACDFLRATPVVSWNEETLDIEPLIEVAAVKAVDR